MNTKKHKSKVNKQGSVVGLILVIGVCLAIIGWGMLQLGFGARLNSAVSVSRITAREAADAGLRQAVYAMNQAFEINGSIPASFSYPALDNSQAGYSYTITPDPNSTIQGSYYNHYLVESTGTSKGESKRVCAITGLRNLFDYGLIVTDSLDTMEGTRIDGYDSSLGPYGINGNSDKLVRIGTTYAGEDYRIFLRNNVMVVGDILVGIGGDPEEIIRPLGTPGPTTGPWGNITEPFEFEPIPVPDCGPYLKYSGDPNVTIGQIGVETYVKYDNLNVPTSGRLNFLGTVYLHVTGEIRLNNSSEILVHGVPLDPTSWSSVIIYLEGDLNVGQGGAINNMTEKPQNFRLFGVGTSTKGEDWTINNSGIYYGIYYAPNATIDVKQSATFFGSISGKKFIMRQSGQMHYDMDLSSLVEYDTGFGIDRWWEEVVP